MSHNLIDPNNPDDRSNEVHRVTVDVVVAPGQDDPKTWDWDALIDGRSALVSSVQIHGALNAAVQLLMDHAVELDGRLAWLLDESDSKQQAIAREGIDIHGKLMRVADDADALATADPSADVSAVMAMLTKTIDRLLTEVFKVDPAKAKEKRGIEIDT